MMCAPDFTQAPRILRKEPEVQRGLREAQEAREARRVLDGGPWRDAPCKAAGQTGYVTTNEPPRSRRSAGKLSRGVSKLPQCPLCSAALGRFGWCRVAQNGSGKSKVVLGSTRKCRVVQGSER
jgi:hypothetical protein